MKIFANVWKKLVVITMIILSISFIKPQPVQAGIGGELMEPICDLLVGLADGFLNVTHHILIGQETTLIRVNLNSSWTDFLRVAVTVLVFIAVLAAAAVITAGAALAVGAVVKALGVAVLGTAKTIVASALIAGTVPILVGATYFGVKAYSADAFDNEIDLPLYSISPERIFSNTIPFFDVNFFNPNDEPFKYQWIHKYEFEEKYKEVGDITNLNFEGGEDVTNDEELKKKIGEALKSFNTGLIKKIMKLNYEGSTYIKVWYSGVAGSEAYQILRVTSDGTLTSHWDIDFTNATDVTAELRDEIAALRNQSPELISKVLKKEIDGTVYLQITIRRNNIYIYRSWHIRRNNFRRRNKVWI